MSTQEIFDSLRVGNTAVLEFFRTQPEHVDMRNLQATEANVQQWDEFTPLHVVAKHGHLSMVRDLVELGATVYSHPFCTYPAVCLAGWERHQEVVDYFLEEIPDKAAGTNDVGVACNLAGRMGWRKQVQMHLERDPLAVHQRGWIGDTPLHWPAHNGHTQIVEMLLNAGANPNVEENNCYGGTPLHWASERHPGIVRMLLSAGAHVNARVTLPKSGFVGCTPLLWCARQNDDSAECATALLEAGADPTLTDAEGKTAWDHAKERIRSVLPKPG